jgi:integrase/recombinase XerD
MGWGGTSGQFDQMCRIGSSGFGHLEEQEVRFQLNCLPSNELSKASPFCPRRFYQAVDQADDVQHALMLRLLFFTAVRVSELCNIQVADVDLEGCKIRVNQGKGGKDRYVLFGKGFATALRTHLAAHPRNRWLFQTRRHSRYTTRRVQQIVKVYAERAGVRATPHTFRHQAITWLTRHSGLADAELQLITGHAKRETLAVYQHVALDGQLEDRYQQTMKDVGL